MYNKVLYYFVILQSNWETINTRNIYGMLI